MTCLRKMKCSSATTTICEGQRATSRAFGGGSTHEEGDPVAEDGEEVGQDLAKVLSARNGGNGCGASDRFLLVLQAQQRPTVDDK
jgi:hypothetical protein